MIRMVQRVLESREHQATRKRKADTISDFIETDDTPASKKVYRLPGAGRKVQAMEVRLAMFEWFIDVRGSLKGRMPMKIFR